MQGVLRSVCSTRLSHSLEAGSIALSMHGTRATSAACSWRCRCMRRGMGQRQPWRCATGRKVEESGQVDSGEGHSGGTQPLRMNALCAHGTATLPPVDSSPPRARLWPYILACATQHNASCGMQCVRSAGGSWGDGSRMRGSTTRCGRGWLLFRITDGQCVVGLRRGAHPR